MMRVVAGSARMDEDREFLRAHRDEAHEVITYYHYYAGMSGATCA
jgi:hypothetical protein